MAKSYHLEIVTPFRKVFTEDVDAIIAAGEDGYFGVMASHAPFLTSLKVGYLKVEKGGQASFFAISGGFAEVLPQGVTILAETAEQASEIDVERAKQSKQRAEERIEAGKKSWDVDRAQLALARSLNRLKIADYI